MIDWNDNLLQQFGYLGLRAQQVVSGFITGQHRSPFHGFSVEFSEHRPYNSGESTRFLDWKLYARSEKLFIKKFEEETNLRCQMIVDGSASMLFPNDKNRPVEMQSKYNFSVFLAAVFMIIFRHQRDAVGLSIVDSILRKHTDTKSTFNHHQYLMGLLQNHLDNIKEQSDRETRLAETLHEVAERIHRRSMVMIFSDLFDIAHDSSELIDALQHLRHNGNEIILFHTIDKKFEEDFDFDNAPRKFIDLENNSVVKIRPAEVREMYRKKFAEMMSEIKEKSPQYGIDYVEADINLGLEGVLMPFFARRRMK
ncbi:MAG: DUF58 domain-containing protein [Bacteroidales bacterium]|nr:DUF58 domain-containing protein [Bacteroidales bacterium]